MSTTATATSSTLRPYGVCTVVGGVGIIAAGVAAIVDVGIADGPWFGFAGVMALFVAVGVTGLRRAAADLRVAHVALTCVAVTMTLFALAHFWAIADEDAAIPFFSAFMMLSALGLIVAGIAILRSRRWTSPLRWLPLATGLCPLTIPVGLALGDVPHFLAIALWGACWAALGAALTSDRH
jgi:hypothetical protein